MTGGDDPQLTLRPDGLAWDLGLEGGLVHRLIVDHAVSLTFCNGVEVRIGSPFTDVAADGSSAVHDPEDDPVHLAPVLRLSRMETHFGYALLDGSLELGFADGSSIKVAVDENYEAWTLGGPQGFKLVSLPGGGLAEWHHVSL